jgi:exosome complex RNA-binding protein Rrp42 (RNase PH superfamily)
VNAAIPCYDILSSSSIAFINGEMLMDPTREEEQQDTANNDDINNGSLTISSLNAIDQIAQITFSGFIDADLVKKAKVSIIELNKIHDAYLKKIIGLKISHGLRES